MFLRLPLIIPTVGEIRWRNHHAKPGWCDVMPSRSKIGLCQIADVESQALRLTAVLDDELQQDQTFARIAYRVPGSKWMRSFWSGSMNQKLLKPVE